MSFYREIRVRPVVRYIVTLYERTEHEDGRESGLSEGMGEFDNARSANMTATAIVRDYWQSEGERKITMFEPARQLKIHWLRGPGEPKEAIRWELEDVDRAPAESSEA